jgi:hypothetical protein
VAAIRPLFRRFFKMESNHEHLDIDVRYDLGNMVGKKRGAVYPNIVSIVSDRKPLPDDSGSESNLVMGKTSDGIRKTVSVSLQSDINEPGSIGRW